MKKFLLCREGPRVRVPIGSTCLMADKGKKCFKVATVNENGGSSLRSHAS